jgi:sigma-B regulation protein RsbU (phosphoserine phosphatase)
MVAKNPAREIDVGIDKHSLTWRVTPDLLGVLDADGKFMHTNPAWFKTLGRTSEEIESRLFFDFIHPDDMGITAKAFVEVQKGNPILQFENRYSHKDGSYRWLSWNAVPEGDIFVCSARDVTSMKEAVDGLAKSKADAQLREQFISMLGHDLRNPLAGATCAAEYLQREDLTERGQIILSTASQSLRRMSKLIDDVLDFARARLGGEIGIVPKPEAKLKPVIELTVAEIRLANPNTELEEIYDFDDPVLCDPDRIAQLLSNLMGNAVFHGDQDGAIRVHARDEGTNLLISITNKGGQIPDKVKALLFEPFKRAEPGSSMNGLGLGLYISKQIADSHNGDIDVVSDGTETTFTLKIPRKRSLLEPVANAFDQRRIV